MPTKVIKKRNAIVIEICYLDCNLLCPVQIAIKKDGKQNLLLKVQ